MSQFVEYTFARIDTFQRSQQAFEPTGQGSWHPLKLVASLRSDHALRSFVYQNGVDRSLCPAIKIHTLLVRSSTIVNNVSLATATLIRLTLNK